MNAKVKLGDCICIDYMDGEPQMEGRTGIVKSVDYVGDLHGTCGGLAVIPEVDRFHIVSKDGLE